MVISVFPNYGSGFQAFERARGNRLQAEAARTEMDLRNRREQAYNRMLEGLPPEQRSMYEVLAPEQGVSLMLQNQQAQAERAGQARDDYYESYNELLPRYAVRYQGAQSDEQRQAILENAQEQFGILGRRMGYQGVSPDVLERELSSYAPEADGGTSAFQTLDARARAAGLEPGSSEYREFMRTGGRGPSDAAQIAGALATAFNRPQGQILTPDQAERAGFDRNDVVSYYYDRQGNPRYDLLRQSGQESRAQAQEERQQAEFESEQAQTEREREESLRQERARLLSDMASFSPLARGVAGALDIVFSNPSAAGGREDQLQALASPGGSDSGRLASFLSPVNAETAFGRLQQMRDNSPTGGALGQVSERELDLLRDSQGQMMLSTSSDILAENLIDFYDRSFYTTHGRPDEVQEALSRGAINDSVYQDYVEAERQHRQRMNDYRDQYNRTFGSGQPPSQRRNRIRVDANGNIIDG
jgi:hypothetical protein